MSLICTTPGCLHGKGECRSDGLRPMCMDPDCKKERHAAGSLGCVSDSTCGGRVEPPPDPLAAAIWKRPPPVQIRQVPATVRVRLEFIGYVDRTHPDGKDWKDRGTCIVLQGHVPELVRDRLMGAWVRALPPVAGAEDRGRWKVVKWGWTGDVVVAGINMGATVRGDSLWLEVPVSG